MLALDQPLGVVAGLALYADHADPRRVYYAATRPRLATLDGRAEWSFVRFRSRDAAEGGVGLLSFTTDLAVDEDRLAQAREALERQGRSEPLLVPVPWTGGRAVLAAALREGDGFVEQVHGETTPNLIADNRALFSLRIVQGLPYRRLSPRGQPALTRPYRRRRP
jgi:hypothetical protein